MNREEWLTEMAKMVTPLFKGFRLYPFRATCGWPCKRGVSLKNKVIGECHFPPVTELDGRPHEIFISPLLDNPLEVSGVLCHEIAHVAAGAAAKHGRQFVQVCRHVGLTRNRPTAAAPGKLLEERLEKLAARLGPYPHRAIALTAQPVVKKKQRGAYCPNCGCTVRISEKWLGQVGPPTCGCGTPMEADGAED